MTTIAQLPPATSVGQSDLLPLSQAGLLYSVSVAQLTANTQPLLIVPTGELLGRNSIGAGGPEAVTLGAGLVLSSGSLAANGADHALFPVQAALSLYDDLVVSSGGAPGLLPVAQLRGIFSAGTGVSITGAGVIELTASAIAGPVGATGAVGPAGPPGPQGSAGAVGQGLAAPAAANSVSAVGAGDYVAIWQNGANAWIPYGQFIGGQTINQLPAAAAAADSDELLVAQGTSALSVQSFGGLWSYIQAKLPTVKSGIVELTANTVLDGAAHNDRILIASAPLTLTANFSNMGTGFSCTVINLGAGAVTFGTGITSGSGGNSLPPGATASLLGLSYSGGSLVWWSGVVPNAPTITVGSITPPAPNAAFMVSGGMFNDAPTALDYSTDGGVTWVAAPSPVLTANAYSFNATGLAAGTYSVRVRDHGDIAVLGVSNNFTIVPPSVSITAPPASALVNAALALTGTVSPGSNAVQVGLSGSATTPPSAWVNASVTNGSWTALLNPAAAGSFYIWARQNAAPSVQAISGIITIVAASVSVTAPVTGVAGSALSITGAVSPAGDAVNVQLAAQNSTVPSAGWVAATVSAGSFNASLTPNAAGTLYVWAQDPVTGATAVSSAIVVAAQPAVTYTINNPGGSYTHGLGTIPLNGGVSPAQVIPTQVALSTSNIVPPTTAWQAATAIYANTLWALYYPTPAAAGNYYVWVETTTGGSQVVSSFTVPVT